MSNLIKRNYFSCNDDEKRVIDSNELVAERIEQLAETLNRADDDTGFAPDGFAEGLDAQTVDALLADGDESGDGVSANVIKTQKAQPGMSSAEASEEAQRIIDDANDQASRIIEDARNQAEADKAAVYDEARRTGHDDGYAAGMAECDTMKAELEEKSGSLDEAYANKCDELEPMFIDTLTDIYEHIFHVRFAESKEVIFYLIQDAVRKIDSNTNFIIHVSKEDYGFVSMQKKDLLSGLSNADTAEIVEDMTLKNNECFIETGAGIFDCSLETQLEGLKRELKLLSYHKEDSTKGSV